MPLRTFLKCVALGVLDNVRAVVHEHTVGRLRRVWATATFPLVTERADDPKLWRASLRTAWGGLVHRHPDALDYFVFMRRNVEATRRMSRDDHRRAVH
jgi:hypothetical protein